MDRWKNYGRLSARIIDPGRCGPSRSGCSKPASLPVESLDAYTVMCFGVQDDETYKLLVLADSPEHAVEQAHGAGHRVRNAFPRDARVRINKWLDRWQGWRRADRCVNCGYALDGLAMVRGRILCPECGGCHALYARKPRLNALRRMIASSPPASA
ncbi:MAG: hypothetical protein IT438_00385 [Phycisphaerales bacterium]|nr:hypothetical protein [Phycisphaerales bacterium]